ncbi:MAG: DUF2232 domain-containing protein [Stomatobaculum sp.]|nr:DUF2232 domain-containing protein [Stomatobaculum sp.]
MNSKTQKLTFGAMLIAVFGVLILLNRQTGGLFEEAFVYIFPLPMTAYAAKYGLRSGLPVFIGMVMITLFCGSFTAIFYATTAALLGLAFGTCLYHRVDSTHTMILVMVLAAVFNLLSTIVLASLFGYNLNQEITEMQTMMTTAMEKAGMVMPENVFTHDYLKRLMIISMIFMGIIQGFLIFEISLMILKLLRFPVQKPKPVREFYPPKWSGYLGIVLFMLYLFTFGRNEETPAATIGQTFGVCGYLYLTCFGAIALNLIIKAYISRSKLLSVLLCIIALVIFPLPLCFFGFFYITGSLHESLLQRLAAQSPEKRGS